MLYRILKFIAGFALRWFYREVRVEGAERVPREGPVLLAVNHPNALLDILVSGWLLKRPLTLTAKATFFEHPLVGPLFRAVGVVPLRRASDEAQKAGPAIDRDRNADAFAAILDALERGRAILIFPEGKVHNEPHLAPLKTGLARLALQARDERGLRGLSIVPLGLNFEDKGEPRSRVLLEVGAPLRLDEWAPAPAGGSPAHQLTAEVDARLRAVTLNFPSAEEAERVRGAAEVLAGVYDRPRPLRDPDPPLADVLDVTRRVDAARRAIDRAVATDASRVARFTERLEAFRRETEGRGIAVNDIGISTATSSAARFLAREAAVVALSGPLAWWGRINHWLPFRLARLVARRTSRTPDQPAQHTVVAGVGLVLLFYALQTALVGWLAGWPWWLLYLVSLPLSATWDLRFQDRMDRARRRIRTYLLFRRDSALRARLLGEVAWLREESAALERIAAEAGATRAPHAAPA